MAAIGNLNLTRYDGDKAILINLRTRSHMYSIASPARRGREIRGV